VGAGEVLVHEGATTGRVDVIVAGRVKASAVGDDGREIVLAVRGPGDITGELSAIDGLPHSATTTALEPVEVLTIGADTFVGFLRDHPDVTLDLLRTVVGRLRDADRKRVEFGSADTVGRVAHRLAELAAKHGVAAADGSVAIDLPLSQTELAGWVGASREAVTRALRVLRDRGVIETGRRSIRIIHPERLDGFGRT